MIAINKNPLSELSDSQLIERLDSLVHKEKETTLEVIRHLIEMDRRSLYLGRGYGSLYEYCTRHLGYSESAAMRRIQTARCIREFPEIFAMLEKNELNLISVCMLAGILNDENKIEVLQESCCKSKRQIEEIVARYKPGKEIQDSVRTIFIKTRSEAAAKASAPDASDPGNINVPVPGSKQGDVSWDNWGKFPSAGEGKNSAVNTPLKSCTLGALQKQKTVLKKKYKLEFAIEPECMKKLEEAKAILSKNYPEGMPLGKLLEEALDAYLDKHSPERKKNRREKREAMREAKKNEQADKLSKTMKPMNVGLTRTSHWKCHKSVAPKRSRHIPQAIQDEVFARDEGRCIFVGPDGVRCNSRWNLHIDHIKPYARGGGHSMHNLRLLCAKHNNLEAENAYGSEFMAKKRRKAIPLRK